MRRQNRFLTAGLILTCALAALVLLGFFWTPYDPNAMAAGPKFDAPSPWQPWPSVRRGAV